MAWLFQKMLNSQIWLQNLANRKMFWIIDHCVGNLARKSRTDTCDNSGTPTDISKMLVFCILHSNLQLRHFYFKWIPYHLTKEQMQARIYQCYEWKLEVCKGWIFQTRPYREVKISAWALHGPKENTKSWPGLGPANFFSAFGPDFLCLSDFKTGPFCCQHIINVFFGDDTFSAIY